MSDQGSYRVSDIQYLIGRRIIELDAPVSHEEGASCYRDLIPDKRAENAFNEVERMERIRTVWRALRKLESRERFIIIRRFGLLGNQPMTLAEIGERLDPPLSRERIRQLERLALRKLREAFLEVGLEEGG